MRSPPARRSRKFNHYWLMFDSPHRWGFYITHSDAPQSVRLLWTSDQLITETSTYTIQNTHNRHIHAPGGIRTHDLSRRAAVDLRLRPRGHWEWLLFMCVIKIKKAECTGRTKIRKLITNVHQKSGMQRRHSFISTQTTRDSVSLNFSNIYFAIKMTRLCINAYHCKKSTNTRQEIVGRGK